MRLEQTLNQKFQNTLDTKLCYARKRAMVEMIIVAIPHFLQNPFELETEGEKRENSEAMVLVDKRKKKSKMQTLKSC